MSFLSKLNTLLRKMVNAKNKKRLKNRDFSVIASNCNGTLILHDLNMRFNSPFVNLWLKADDYIKILKNLQHYLECDLGFTQEPGINYPIGVLDDVKVYFTHYKTCEEAKEKWTERSKRLNMDNLFIMFTDRDGCTKENLLDFDALPYQNKVVFTHIPYSDIKSSYYIRGFEEESSVGMCHAYKNDHTGKKYYDDFDYVSWFNQELEKYNGK